MKTWTLKVNEEELRALISYHAGNHELSDNPSVETSARIHDLTKRLNKGDASEGENGEAKPEVKPDPWASI